MRDKRNTPLKDVMLAKQLSQENISYIATMIIDMDIDIIVIVIAKNTTAWIASLKLGKTYLNGQYFISANWTPRSNPTELGGSVGVTAPFTRDYS